MGFFKSLFGRKSEPSADVIPQAGESLDQARLGRMFERPPSFSLVAFPGDMRSELPAFLSACHYELRRSESYNGSFEELYEGLGQPSGPNNTIVQKAWFLAAYHPISLDPEMVLITETDQLSQMSAKARGAVKSSDLERGSETVALAELGPEGVIRQTWYCQGEATGEATIGGDGHQEISERPDSNGLSGPSRIWFERGRFVRHCGCHHS
jgi:hypothetical protein